MARWSDRRCCSVAWWLLLILRLLLRLLPVSREGREGRAGETQRTYRRSKKTSTMSITPRRIWTRREGRLLMTIQQKRLPASFSRLRPHPQPHPQPRNPSPISSPPFTYRPRALRATASTTCATSAPACFPAWCASWPLSSSSGGRIACASCGCRPTKTTSGASWRIT